MNQIRSFVLIAVLSGILTSASAGAAGAPQVNIPASTYLLLLKREQQREQKEKREEIKGIGVVFTSQVEKIKEADTFTFRVFARGCGKVTLPRQPQTESLKQGDRVKFKFRQAGDCDIAGWEKF